MARADLIFRLIGQTDGISRDLKRLNSQFNGVYSTALKVGSGLGIAFGGQQVLSAIGNGIQKVAAFEQQMDKVAAISRAVPADIRRLSDNALDLGRKSKFTATQIGAMQETLARLGFSARQIIKTTDSVRKLATAAGEDLAPSAEILAGTMKSFNLEASESEMVANVMAESFATTSLNLEKFGAAMSNVGAIANVANVSLEDTTSMIGTLTDRNIDASKAGTDLRKIFIELAANGISYQDAMAKIRGATDKVTTATTLFGVRASAAAIILSENEKKVSELSAGYKDANTELSKMVETMEDNLITDVALLSSAMDGVVQEGSAFNGFLRQATQNLTTLVSQLNDGLQNDGAFSKFSDFVKLTLVSSPLLPLIQGFNLLTKNTENYNKELEESEKKQKDVERAINSTVEAAFASGNIEAYIKALDNNINKEEIIIRIRERQKKISDELAAVEAQRLAAVNKLVVAKQRERAEMEGIHELQTLGIGGPQQSAFQQQLKDFDMFNKMLASMSTNIEKVNVKTQQLTTVALSQFGTAFKEIDDVIINTSAVLEDFANTALVGFGEAIGDALTGVGSFGDSIINAVGGFMNRLGQQMIQLGVAKTILDKLSAGLPGGVLIGAGVALVAASRAISNTLNSGIGGVSASGSGSGSRALSNVNRSNNEQQTVDFRIRGTDLYGSIVNTIKSNGNRGGAGIPIITG